MPDPLHPAVVHLPIALAILMPLLAVLAVACIWRGLLPVRTWAVLVLLQALLVGSGWLALETGEEQEERVERIVSEDAIHEHEETAERFVTLAGVGLVVIALGLLPGTTGALGRGAGLIATLIVLGASVGVGHSGGELVYKHGAAAAYLDPATLEAIAAGGAYVDETHDHDEH